LEEWNLGERKDRNSTTRLGDFYSEFGRDILVPGQVLLRAARRRR
jgi:hypothetical protein